MPIITKENSMLKPLYTDGEIGFIKDVCSAVYGSTGVRYVFNVYDDYVVFTKEDDKYPEITITIDDNIISYYHKYATAGVPDSSRKMFVNMSASGISKMIKNYYYNMDTIY